MARMAGRGLSLIHDAREGWCDAISRLWDDANGQATVRMETGQWLYHYGLVSHMGDIRPKIAIWTSRTIRGAADYKNVGSDRRLACFRLSLPVMLADFTGSSFRHFTEKYCGERHNVMRDCVRAWCIVHRLHGIAGSNRDPEEVIIALPRRCLILPR